MDQTMHKKWMMHLQEVIFLLELVRHLEGTPGRIDRDHRALRPLGQVALASVPLTTLQLEDEFLVIVYMQMSTDWSRTMFSKVVFTS
jgi:hypothetical protein